MSEVYRVLVCSDPGHEQLVAEIHIGDQFVALLSQENGPEQTLIELVATEVGDPIKLNLRTFEMAVAEAKKRLWELRRVPRA